MARAVTAYQPINTLKPAPEELWIADGPLVRFSYAGMRLPLPMRMTIVRGQR